MFVTYTPDGDEAARQRWVFDPGQVRASQAEVVEKRYGQPWDQFTAAVQRGEVRARRVLLWHLLAREHHTLRLEDVPDFATGELAVEHSVAELRAIADRAEKATMDEQTREQLRAALDIQMSEAIAREDAVVATGVPVGKAGSPSGD